MARSTQPILTRQLGDSRKLAQMVSHESKSKNDALRGYQQIVAADRLSISFEPCPKTAIFAIDGKRDRQNFHDTKHRFELAREPRGIFLDCTVPEFRCDNDTRADIEIAHLSHSLCCAPLRVPNDIRDDVRVEQEAHYSSI